MRIKRKGGNEVMTRRLAVGSVLSLLTPGAAFAATRVQLPGGGSCALPQPYRSKTDYPNYSDRSPRAVIGYRNWRSTMSGHPECDGFLGVGRADQFDSLKAFAGHAGAAGSIAWSDADRIPGQRWDGNEKRYQAVEGRGPDGPELTSDLSVHVVGFFDVYDKPSVLYAREDRRGVFVGVWIYNSHGGMKAARRLAGGIAASFTP